MSLLREYIRLILTEMEIEYDGAGIVVVRNFDGEWRVLALIDKHGMDVPKGHKDGDETPMETALRETEEETKLSKADLTFEWGEDPLVIDGHLVMFLASTESEAFIPHNPKTGRIEHRGVQWLTFDQMMNQVLNFLTPAIVWAQNKICKLGKIKRGEYKQLDGKYNLT